MAFLPSLPLLITLILPRIYFGEACHVHRRSLPAEKTWFVCTAPCEDADACCLALASAAEVKACHQEIATATIGDDAFYSVVETSSTSISETVDEWQTFNSSTPAWTASANQPFADGSTTTTSKVAASSITESGGMHRLWAIAIAEIAEPTTLLLFLTADVFVDMEDLVEAVHGVEVVRTHSDRIIDTELPVFHKPQQHVVLLDIMPTATETPLRSIEIKLHWRYPEPSLSGSRTTLILPPPMVWNQASTHSSPDDMEIVTVVAGDETFVSAVTLFCSLTGSVLLGHAIWTKSLWN